MCGLGPTDVDVCEFYDPFSFEIIRQFEAYGFCGEGEGGDFVMDGTIGPGGRFPITTDGGLMSYSHGGATVQLLQRVIRAVQQLRGDCATRQVPGARVAMCSNGGAGALFTDVMLLGRDQP
jgi:acetyl-CoA acetyltransferase